MKNILITGFEPFGGEEINPSWELAKLFNNKKYQDYHVVSKKLPTVFYKSASKLKDYINEYKPKIVFCIGQAGGSNTIRIERVAINLNDANIPDNEGNKPTDEYICDNGINAYFSTLPVREIYKELNNHDIKTSLSLSAGAYVCNHVFYNLIHTLESNDGIGGFIHIPYIPQQIKNKPDKFSMDLNTLEKALDIIINTTINYKKN